MSKLITSRTSRHLCGRTTRSPITTHAQARIIRLCRECVYYSEADDTCKVLGVVNHVSMDVTRIKSLHCRTREDLCGMNARYYEPLHIVEVVPPSTPTTTNVRFTDDVDVFSVTYYIDGSVNINTDNKSVDNYYDTLHQDFNDVY